MFGHEVLKSGSDSSLRSDWKSLPLVLAVPLAVQFCYFSRFVSDFRFIVSLSNLPEFLRIIASTPSILSPKALIDVDIFLP